VTSNPHDPAPGTAGFTEEALRVERGPGAPEAPGDRVRMGDWLDRVEDLLERVLAASDMAREHLLALTRHLTTPSGPGEGDERLAELLARAESLQSQVQDLEAAISRQSRVQFKANALLEGRGEEVARALAVLQEIATKRDEALESRRAAETRRMAELRSEGRAELAAELLPVLDGIERALESGEVLLERHRRASSSAARGRGLLGALVRTLGGEPPPEESTGSALEAWLEGLTLGRDRFLTLLAAEGIVPVPSLQLPFNPRFQVALATESREDVATGTVVRVLRTGYRRGERPVRLAEVVVARVPQDARVGDDDVMEPRAPEYAGSGGRAEGPTPQTRSNDEERSGSWPDRS
jgi:molecular chaperone GrpE (heat shock protein)